MAFSLAMAPSALLFILAGQPKEDHDQLCLYNYKAIPEKCLYHAWLSLERM